MLTHNGPNRSTPLVLRFGEEEQRNERTLIFMPTAKNQSKRYVACSDVELLARFELAVTAFGGLRVLFKQASPVRSPVRKAIL